MFTESDYLNCNKSNLFIMNGNNDIDDNESLLNIMKVLKNNNKKNNEKNEKKLKSINQKINNNNNNNKVKTERNSVIKVEDSSKKKLMSPNSKPKLTIQGKSTSNPSSKKISFINNFRNSFVNSDIKSNNNTLKTKKRKNVNKSLTVIRNTKLANNKNDNNLKVETINTHSKILSDITLKSSMVNRNIIQHYNEANNIRKCSYENEKLKNTYSKNNISSNQISISINRENYISNSPSKREKISNNLNNYISEKKEYISRNRKNSLKKSSHKKLLTATNFNLTNYQIQSPKILNINKLFKKKK